MALGLLVVKFGVFLIIASTIGEHGRGLGRKVKSGGGVLEPSGLMEVDDLLLVMVKVVFLETVNNNTGSMLSKLLCSAALKMSTKCLPHFPPPLPLKFHPKP